MVEDELPFIAAVDARAYPYPWSEQIFRDCPNVGYNCLVYEDEQGMLGYGIMSMAVGEAHILNLCVMPEKQGRGYGREILLCMLDLAKARNTETVFLEVRLSNEPAKRLYERVGFNEVGIRKNYYPADKGREDALIFALNLYYD
jgi:ribosomal-protein-alanine N-acetyltransferase